MAALNNKWSDYVPNGILYNGLEFANIGLLVDQLCFAGTVYNLLVTYFYLLWDHTK
jgi:hypothetical protein